MVPSLIFKIGELLLDGGFDFQTILSFSIDPKLT